MGLMFPGFLIVSTKEGRQRNSPSFKERARVRMGSPDHDNSPHPRPSLPPEGERACVCARSSLAHRRGTLEENRGNVRGWGREPRRFTLHQLVPSHSSLSPGHLSLVTCHLSLVARSLVTRHSSPLTSTDPSANDQ